MNKNHLHQFHAKHRGFTLVEIMIVVAIIGILVGIAVPGFIRARMESRAKACQENQSKVFGASQEWALANNSSTVPTYDDLVDPSGHGYLQEIPVCPTTNTEIPIPPQLDTYTHCPTSEPGH